MWHLIKQPQELGFDDDNHKALQYPIFLWDCHRLTHIVTINRKGRASLDLMITKVFFWAASIMTCQATTSYIVHCIEVAQVVHTWFLKTTKHKHAALHYPVKQTADGLLNAFISSPQNMINLLDFNPAPANNFSRLFISLANQRK